MDICSKASRKMYALARVAPYMDMSKRLILMSAFFSSQFSYCPLVCNVSQCVIKNRKINRLHESSLYIIHSDN